MNKKDNKVKTTKTVSNNKKRTTTKKETVKHEEIVKRKESKIALVIILLCLIVIPLLTSYTFYYPKIKEKKDIKKIKSEIKDVLKNNIQDISNITNEYITSGTRQEIEDKIESYLIETTKINNELYNIINDEKINNTLSLNNLKDDDLLDYLNTKKEELDSLKEKKELLKEEYSNYKNDDEKLNDLYIELFNEINESKEINNIENIISSIDESIPIISFLNDNKTYCEIEEDKIIFNKRSIKEKYDELVTDINNNQIVAELINDTKGPNITASDITIYLGNSLNIKDKVKCIDEVDGEVECKISGTYDNNKKGTYSIKISSTDKSNNTSVKNIKVYVKEKSSTRVNTSNKPYYIEVIRNQNVVIVYGLDENKEYNKIVKVFTVSVGRNGKTPTGTYKTTKGYTWGSLINGVYGQYTTRITGSYLFHSVPYYSKNKGDLEWEEYNKLGTAASAGCVRMTVRDVKWIYDNIENGTTVKIYDGSLPSGVTKPSVKKIDGNSPNKGWDPTDPDPNNPWKK